MINDFDLSIVVSSFNREDKVLKTVETVMESDLSGLKNVELIVIDDGSPRPVAPLLEGIAQLPNITVRNIRQNNSGIGATRNRGFREARSEKIIFLDDDIILKKHTLKDLLEAHRQNEGAVIFGIYPFISYSSPSLRRFADTFFGFDGIVAESTLERSEGITSGLLFVNKGMLKGLQDFYKDNLRIPAAEEHEIIFRLYKAEIPVYHARHIAAIHNHPLRLDWLAGQQYKYGLATAEAFIKNPEILGMRKFKNWEKSFTASGKPVIRQLINRVFDSGAGRAAWLWLARAVEWLFPRVNHNRLFGLVVSNYFRGGYREGLKKFTARHA